MGGARPFIVGVDIDGVLYRLVEVLRDWLHTRRNIPLSALTDPSVYSLEESWGITGKFLVEEMIAGVKAGEVFWKGGAYESGLVGLRALKDAGFYIRLITARDLPGVEALCYEATTHWLNSPGVEATYDDLVLTSDKASVECDYLIDDYEKHVRAAHSIGRPAILMRRRWNQSVVMEQASWAQIPAMVAAVRAAANEGTPYIEA